jgi:succinate dehydrogenase/fumarate reductase flavoprotein subunit
MGNSILDYSVYGRRAGIYAAKYIKKTMVGKLTMNHIETYTKMLKEANMKTTGKAPILLPDYRGENILSHSLDIL